MIRETKVVTCCPEKRFCLLDGNKSKQITSSAFLAEVFTQNALYNCETFLCSEFFGLSCISTPKYSLLPAVLFFTDSARFCLSLLLQTLSLLFLCKTLSAILRNSSSSRIYLYPVGKNYFIKGTNLS